MFSPKIHLIMCMNVLLCNFCFPVVVFQVPINCLLYCVCVCMYAVCVYIYTYSGVKSVGPLPDFFIFFSCLSHFNVLDHQTNLNINQR